MKIIGREAREGSFAPQESDFINNMVLAAGVAQTATVPTEAAYVVFSFSVDIWVKVNGTAVVPTVTTTAGTSAELNPGIRRVAAGDTISIISEVACKGSLAYYKAC